MVRHVKNQQFLSILFARSSRLTFAFSHISIQVSAVRSCDCFHFRLYMTAELCVCVLMTRMNVYLTRRCCLYSQMTEKTALFCLILYYRYEYECCIWKMSVVPAIFGNILIACSQTFRSEIRKRLLFQCIHSIY